MVVQAKGFLIAQRLFMASRSMNGIEISFNGKNAFSVQ